MKRKRKLKSTLYLVLGLLGLAALGTAIFAVPDERAFDLLTGALLGFGSAAAVIGLGGFFILRLHYERLPEEKWRKSQINETDERNIALNDKAGRAAGRTLLYASCALAPIGGLTGNWALLAIGIIMALGYNVVYFWALHKFSKCM